MNTDDFNNNRRASRPDWIVLVWVLAIVFWVAFAGIAIRFVMGGV